MSQGWTVNGSDLMDIQAGQTVLLFSSDSSSSRPGTVPGGAFFVSFLGADGAFLTGSGSEDVNAEEIELSGSLGRPIFFRAIFVARLENILIFVCMVTLSSDNVRLKAMPM